MIDNVEKEQEEGIYIKICKLPSCKKEFKTTRDWQKFCKREHQEIYHKNRKRSDSDIRRKLNRLEKEQKEIMKRFSWNKKDKEVTDKEVKT